ncbi:hypothetical protein CONLIGDRAFT_697120 [Coniochaeta ligniaria NRRL 30616]|uniref:F-box domain-containing protein n=1 Tax=Coniochaeta ligniaria NRRL 30616 TaxID=1408157 RepID=A0A1J7JLC0_9PEZI|nr:hypothetical protein CONLIGDRAFT_697120 [Coniochaeta ligniaria NRRL 30616]
MSTSTRAMALRLESFPNEILTGIAELLDFSHPPSLVAFAQTSKRHYAISSRFLVRTVKITLGERYRLIRDVQEWERMLLRDSAFTYVRRLIIYYSILDPKSVPVNSYLALQPCERYDDTARGCWDLYRCWRTEAADEPARNEDWQTVARLVGQLPGLTDMFYVHPGQFPPCILEIIHKELPQCRLHHYTFHLKDPNGLSNYERALAKSPCLYSIGNRGHARDDMSWALARRHAPRLKRVCVWLYDDISRDDGIVNYDGVNGATPLEHFQLGTLEATDLPLGLPFRVVSSIAFGDLSALRVLKLDTVIDYQTLPAPDNFPSLVTLTLTCTTSPVPDPYWDTLLAFLRNLPRIHTLQLMEWKRSVSIVPGLSPNLRKLDLSTHLFCRAPLRSDHIQQLSDLCPHLEDLTIEIRRSRGDTSEVALYRALGRLPRLQRLTLKLDASPPPVIYITEADGTLTRDTSVEPWFDAWDTQYLGAGLHPHRQGHVRDTLVNSAIDHVLACSIFEVLDGAKHNITGGKVLPLELLEVGANYFCFLTSLSWELKASLDA